MNYKENTVKKARVKIGCDTGGIETFNLYEGKVFDFIYKQVEGYREGYYAWYIKEDNNNPKVEDPMKDMLLWDEDQLDFNDVDEKTKLGIYFKEVKKDFKKISEDILIKLPQRATKGSAGYDFYLPYDVVIEPKQEVMIWTDIKVKMPEDIVFEMIMRSSYGIKKSLMMKNLVPKIDSDYYDNETTDGNIGLCLYNYGDTIQELKKGDAFCQGTFFKYYITDDDIPVSEKRIGGIGSTTK